MLHVTYLCKFLCLARPWVPTLPSHNSKIDLFSLWFLPERCYLGRCYLGQHHQVDSPVWNLEIFIMLHPLQWCCLLITGTHDSMTCTAVYKHQSRECLTCSLSFLVMLDSGVYWSYHWVFCSVMHPLIYPCYHPLCEFLIIESSDWFVSPSDRSLMCVMIWWKYVKYQEVHFR